MVNDTKPPAGSRNGMSHAGNLREVAREIRLLTDVDGVLTDGGVYYSARRWRLWTQNW